ncbi:transposase family protein, partial [Phocaeicola vulgatus]|nr:transposase family protein [Phocaeicola vulgatus]
MKPERLLRAILPDVLIDNFDIVNFDKSADRFDIYLDEKRKWLDNSSNEIFSYDWDLSEFDGTRLNSEFVS